AASAEAAVVAVSAPLCVIPTGEASANRVDSVERHTVALSLSLKPVPGMKEVLLRMFFEEDATAAEVAQDLIGTRAAEPPGFRSSANYAVEPMTRMFRITSRHVVRIVDAMLRRELTSEDVGTIVFCMEASDRFVWDADD